MSSQVDHLFLLWLAIAVFFSLLIAGLVIFFALRFKRRRPDEVGHPEHGSNLLELTWSVIPLGIMLFMFGWGTKIYFENYTPPDDAVRYYVVGKQWMWKFQHPQGTREINDFHVPLGTPIELVITSEDVIHSLFIPAFRIKRDAVPGRYSTAWFKATKKGTFHIFCAEYCGAEHSLMIGNIIVMEPDDYQAWLQSNRPPQSLAASGKELYESNGCGSCHRSGNESRGPDLDAVYGRTVHLLGGGTVKADEQYLRESIMDPAAKVVAGFQPIMPTYQTQLTEEEVLQLISYLKTLGQTPSAPQGASSTPPTPSNAEE